MNTVYLILGILILTITIIELIWTILWVDRGAGPITSRLSAACWKGLRKISRDNSTIFSISGPVILSLTLLSWVLLLWAGWVFVFAGGGTPLLDTQNRGEVDWIDTIYFAGYTVFTLGIGDFVPAEGFWKIATILASGSGMLFITMSASYVISILSGVTEKRSFADTITGLGEDSLEIVKQAWNGKDFKSIDLFLITYASQLSKVTAQHKAYPILHYYHSSSTQKALTVAVAVFDEALMMLRYGIPEAERPNPVNLKNARSSVLSYIETNTSAYIKPADQAPPIPDLEHLRQSGVPAVTNENFEHAIAELHNRRKKLLGLLEADARSWPSGKNNR
ncbi:potassium channel family protein [Sediminibacillus massiliensis]|uniref:potassium channel family protein n=1 Tax=Sediminibacillus massiliensis TaxID=1926277 RepID=UPI0009883042|nr:potassium channel family protein [Sediminibacillus massiliensis]